jgi:hypothetical protein
VLVNPKIDCVNAHEQEGQMKRIQTLAAATALSFALGVTGASAAPEQPKPKQIASALCKAEKQADKAAFKATYGQNAMRDCKRANSGEATEVAKNAAQVCKEERAADPDAFAATYGSNGNGKNAFGKCVSAKARELAKQADDKDHADATARKSAAKQCDEERGATAATRDAFVTKYGTGAKGRNAFGKCVSKLAKALKDDGRHA